MRYPLVMVLDGETRSTLSVVTGLGRRGVPVIVGSGTRLSRSGLSRYVRGRYSYPSPVSDPDAAHRVILQNVKKYRPAVIMPVFDNGLALVYSRYEEYAKLAAITPNPGPELSKSLIDKGNLASYAERFGVPSPKTFSPATLEEATELSGELPYPVLIKPVCGTAGAGIEIIDEAGAFLKALSYLTEPPVIQEFIEGEDLDLTILCIHGKAVAGSVYTNVRNAPLPYGPPVAARTIRDDKLMEIGIDFLSKIGYHGVAHIDFRRDSKDGLPKILDFNPRLAGTNAVSLSSGVDFGFMLYLHAIGEHIEPCFDYELDKEYRWVIGELRHLVQTPHKSCTLKKLADLRGVETDITWKDPLPSLAIFAEAVRKAIASA